MLFFQQFVYSTAILFAGHISGSSRELDAVSLAISVSNVTGFVVIIGLSSAADTLCPQSFGAKNYKRVGEVYQQGLMILAIAVLPVAALWINSESLFLLLQQPPCVVPLASQFLRVFILMLPPLIVMTMTQRYLQAQSVVWVFTLTGLLFNLLTAALCALFLYGLHLDVYYIAVAMVVAAYLATGFLVMYIKVRGLHKLTWGGWSFKSLDNWWLFLKLGLPGFLMVAFEWWTFEISVLVSGSLGETALGVNTILLQLLTLMFMFPLGTGTAVSVRVGNALGAGNSLGAKRASYVALFLQVFIVSLLATVLGLCHNVVGRIFTEDEDVIRETSYTLYAALVLIFFDQIQGTISGVFRGAGLQIMAACINFSVFYLVGLPIGVCLALLTDLGTLGMWIGLSIASVTQACVFIGILFSLNWDKLAAKAVKNAAMSVHRVTNHTANESGDNTSASGGDLVELVSYKEAQHPLISETETETHVSETPSTLTSSTEDLVEQESDPLESVPPTRRLHLLLCRGGIVLVGVCLVVLSGVLAGVFRHDQLEAMCDTNCTCLTNVSVSCVCSTIASSVPHAIIAPTPYPL
ncbi:multidrug and toxin extrusion protein 1-like isoform X2 [Halichondria panicea]